MNNKILIVDDIEINRDMLEMILGDTYDILQAEDGNQALEIVDQYRAGNQFRDFFRLREQVL